ncbi:MAG: ATP synthase F1 subunit epsilon [Patescibacteria group bacterium]|nr:ATP synthase F1 subunit epsilon [Patescibacteria group bacterium]
MAMLKFKLATPERLVLEAEIDSVSIPTQMGQITVLPNHLPLVANLEPGELIIRRNGREEYLAVSGGVAQVNPGSQVMILADSAERAEEIDVARAEAARERAAVLQLEAKDDRKFADTAAQLAKHLARLRVARRRHPPHHTPGPVPED